MVITWKRYKTYCGSETNIPNFYEHLKNKLNFNFILAKQLNNPQEDFTKKSTVVRHTAFSGFSDIDSCNYFILRLNFS